MEAADARPARVWLCETRRGSRRGSAPPHTPLCAPPPTPPKSPHTERAPAAPFWAVRVPDSQLTPVIA